MPAPGAIVLGTHLAGLSSGWKALKSERTLLAAIDEAVALRYDLIEIPLLDPLAPFPNLRAKQKQRKTCFWFNVSLPVRCHLPAAPELARHYLGRALNLVAQSGGSALCGSLGWTPGLLANADDLPRARALMIEVLADLAIDAQRRGIVLLLEPANRYETSLCNTLADGAEIVQAIDLPNVRLLVNTQHMHFEESSPSEAIRMHASAIAAIHLAENTGGRLGTGATSWSDYWQPLNDSAFSGALIVSPLRSQHTISAAEAERCAAALALPFLRTAVRAIQSPPKAERVIRPVEEAAPTHPPETKPAPLRKHPNTKSYRRKQ